MRRCLGAQHDPIAHGVGASCQPSVSKVETLSLRPQSQLAFRGDPFAPAQGPEKEKPQAVAREQPGFTAVEKHLTSPYKVKSVTSSLGWVCCHLHT